MAPLSPRVSLARLARDAALADPGVVSLDGGRDGRRATGSGGERLEGVVSAARAGGGYTLDLHVVAVPDDLHAMGDRLRQAVDLIAQARGLGDELASVSVHVEDVVAP